MKMEVSWIRTPNQYIIQLTVEQQVQWRIQDFPDGVTPILKVGGANLLFWPKFS